MRPDEPITIAGAGLAGALLAVLLAQRGWKVELFEKRPDPRVGGFQGGRSINMALAERGMAALRSAGLTDEVMAQAVMMRGRMVHFADGGTQLQRYGRDDSEVIWSVHRGRLVTTLVAAAERAGARVYFDAAVEEVDFDARILRAGGRDHAFSVLVGADGAGSAVRAAMQRVTDLGERFDPLGHSYKELEVPPAADGGFRLEPNALHIWPRDSYMCIALPNSEASFTVTLFLPNEGDPSFATVQTPAQAEALFQRDFADALPLIPELRADFAANPTSLLGTLYLERWALDGRAVLLGDAAHAMVPFHGQGMNCALEDCLSLVREIDATGDWEDVFARFATERQRNAAAIQAMALENYIEMRDRVDDADYLLQRQLERLLAEHHPGRFIPRYAMVTFTRIPYALARERGEVQRRILVDATAGCSAIGDVDLAAADRMVVERLSPCS